MSDSMIDEPPANIEPLDTADAIPGDAATAAPDADDADQGDDGTGDLFPRRVVEKLRRESAGHRERATAAEEQVAALQDRAQAAETRVAAMQRQTVEGRVKRAGMRPSAVWAVANLDDMLADDGSVDMAAVDQAMRTARSTLGIEQRRVPYSVDGERFSGAGTGREEDRPMPSFVDSFRPRKHD